MLSVGQYKNEEIRMSKMMGESVLNFEIFGVFIRMCSDSRINFAAR